jgi:hypothetical protein
VTGGAQQMVSSLPSPSSEARWERVKGGVASTGQGLEQTRMGYSVIYRIDTGLVFG